MLLVNFSNSLVKNFVFAARVIHTYPSIKNTSKLYVSVIEIVLSFTGLNVPQTLPHTIRGQDPLLNKALIFVYQTWWPQKDLHISNFAAPFPELPACLNGLVLVLFPHEAIMVHRNELFHTSQNMCNMQKLFVIMNLKLNCIYQL